ncbi:MAG: transcriptional repressor [Mucispirillum sp.]|nr:transcriptional repressor [Mucispirillum sp.]
MLRQQIDKNREYFKNFLSTQKLRLTMQRQIIFDEFMKHDSHMDVDTLYAVTKDIDSNIGLATIYRTIKLLMEAGIVREVQFGDGRSYYETVMGRQHHDHLICEVCGKNIEFNDAEIEEIQEKVAAKYKFKLTNHSMNLFGVCEKCRSLGKG